LTAHGESAGCPRRKTDALFSKTDVLFSKNRFFSLVKEVPRFGNAKTDLAFLDIHT
jgi:hypothetical protein